MVKPISIQQQLREAHFNTTATTSTKLLLMAGYDTSNPIPIPQVSPLESYRTLGDFISPSGFTKKAYEILTGYSRDYASAVTGSTYTSDEA
jgi:hypothetical protein